MQKLSNAETLAIEEYRQFCKMRRSLENISMLARREKRKAKARIEADTWAHIIRFCEEAGVVANILRAPEQTPPAKEGK